MDEDILISKINEGFVKIFCPKEIGYKIRDHYRFFAPGYKYNPEYKNPERRNQQNKHWDGKTSLINLQNRLFPYGLLNNLTNYLDKENITYTLDFNTSNDKDYRINNNFLMKFYSTIFENTIFYPRDYQHEAIRNLLYNKRAIVEEATASGKSLIIYCLIRYLLAINKRIVLIVPNIMLVEQMKKEFIDYGWEKCDDYLTVMYTNHIPNNRKPVLVSTFQSLALQDDSFIMRYTAAIVDEVHQAPTESITGILEKCVYADHRMGMTGTLPDHTNPEEHLKIYKIYGYLGPLVAQKKASELMDEGWLSKVKIAILILKYPHELCLRNKNRNYDEELLSTIHNEKRNNIFGYILKHISQRENTIILCHLLEHLDSIYNYVSDNYGNKFKIRKISGEINATARIDIQNETENSEGILIIATYGTMAVGVNIKKLHNIVLGSSHKAKIRILQSIGRGLRLHESKECLSVFDVIDDLRYIKRTGTVQVNHLWEHGLKRKSYYKSQKYPFVVKKLKLEEL